jgi:Transposase DDE domain group 1
VGSAGLIPLLRLAESAGLHELVEEHLSVDAANPVAKTGSLVAGMLAGADSIDDLDVLRHGAMPRLVAGVRAPSTLGTYLRSFTHGHVRQLDAVASRLLAGLAERVPGLLAGGEALAWLDVDDTIREVHGHAKQAAAFGYSGVRGLNAQLAVVSTPTTAPVIAGTRLRRGNTASGRGGGRLLAQAVRTARRAGVTGRILVRADSRLLPPRLRRRGAARRGVVFGHGPDERPGGRGDRPDPRGRLDPNHVPQRGLGRPGAALGL